MLEPAVIFLRLAQYLGGMVLFGSSLFALYALPHPSAGSRMSWLRPLLALGAALLLVSTLLGLVAQTAVLAGSLSEGLKASSLTAVVSTMGLGQSALVRAAAAGVALLLLVFAGPTRLPIAICAGLGAIACASFSWMGHGASTEGSGGLLHLGADIVHALAAGMWLGALAGFLLLLAGREPGLNAIRLKALQGFSGIGSTLVAVLVATGLANSWFLVSPAHIADLLASPYGRLLSLKLVMFVGMLGLAGANRFRLTPALAGALDAGRSADSALSALRRSLLLESSFGLAVLGLVAWFGMLEPAAAQ